MLCREAQHFFIHLEAVARDSAEQKPSEGDSSLSRAPANSDRIMDVRAMKTVKGGALWQYRLASKNISNLDTEIS